jgi:hypothetical protein
MATGTEHASKTDTPEPNLLHNVPRFLSQAIHRSTFIRSRCSTCKLSRSTSANTIKSRPIDIVDKIQALPQELQDMIFHFTLLATLPPYKIENGRPAYIFRSDILFASSSSGGLRIPNVTVLYPTLLEDHPGPRVIPVDGCFRFPAALQINSKTRKAMAEILYKDASFHLQGSKCNIGSWISRVPREYRLSTTIYLSPSSPKR